MGSYLSTFPVSHRIVLSVQRYYHYVERGVPSSHLAPMDEFYMRQVHRLIPTRLLEAGHMFWLVSQLEKEIEHDYKYSLRKGIGTDQLDTENLF